MEIGAYAFNGCQSLQRIYLPSTLKRIGRFAFRDCSLIDVILPQGIEVVEKNAFQGCSSMRRFFMPDTLEKLEIAVLEYLDAHPELKTAPNTEDMWDCYDRYEDVDDSEDDEYYDEPDYYDDDDEDWD